MREVPGGGGKGELVINDILTGRIREAAGSTCAGQQFTLESPRPTVSSTHRVDRVSQKEVSNAPRPAPSIPPSATCAASSTAQSGVGEGFA